ncbi:cytochrome P450 [Paxillus ammoniavirescens]|nr:cytochrome P450 [Paxillus ammoniavirescens]
MFTHTSTVAVGLACAVALVSVWLTKRKRNSSGLPYPPGPKGLPLIGSVFDINMKEPLATYKEWARKYGDIVHTQILGQDMVVINSEKVARILGDQRGTVYADRPKSALYRMFGLNFITPLLEYGDEWRMHRKLYHSTLRAEAVDKYQDLCLGKARDLIANLCQDKDSSMLEEHLHLYMATVVLEVTYGHEVKGMKDPAVTAIHQIVRALTTTVTAERASLYIAFPLLEHFPSWFPGLGFTAAAPQCKQLFEKVLRDLFSDAKRQMDSNSLRQCMIFDFFENKEMSEADATNAVGGVYLAAEETTTSVLHTLILAMVLHPEVQARAHAEIDAVVGQGIVPAFEDRKQLPYLQAVICETMRWNPIATLGIPHTTTQSDIYEGYYIPKGSTVIFNTWAMTRNCTAPERFDPDRFMLPDGQLSPEVAHFSSLLFGFGRRICPGRFFAEKAIWAAVTTILSTLRIDKAKDALGNEIEVKPVFIQAVAVHPAPFPCSITRRFAEKY